MVAKKQKYTTAKGNFEEKESTGKIGRILTSVALYGLMLLLGYVVCATPETGTAMGSIRDVLCGLGGSIAICIPLMIGWAATLVMKSAVGKKISPWKTVCDAGLFLCLFTSFQLFVTEYVIHNVMNMQNFFNYVRQSFSFGHGGGAVGAILSWWLYKYFGKWGGLLATLVIVLLLLTATNRAQKFVRWAIKVHQVQQHRRQQKKAIQSNDDMFKLDDQHDEEPFRNGDPLNDNLSVDPDGKNQQKGSRRTRKEKEVILDPKQWPIHGNPDSSDITDSDSQPDPQPNPRDVYADERKRRALRNGRKPWEEKTVVDHRPVKERMAHNDEPSKKIFERKNSQKNVSNEETNGRPVAVPVTEVPTAPAPNADTSTEKNTAPAEQRSVSEKDTAPDEQRSISEKDTAPDEQRSISEKDTAPDEQRSISEKDMTPDERQSIPEKDADAPSSNKETPSPAEQEMILPIEDLTIDPDSCDVLENDVPSLDPPKRSEEGRKLARPVHHPEEDEEESYNYPPIDLLEMGVSVQENHQEDDMRKATLLEETLRQFGIETKLTGIAHGPAVTRFELKPAAGVRVSRITSLADDIAMRLQAMSIRIEAPIPGKDAIGVEIPNEKVEMVRLRDVLESPEARKSQSKLSVGLGKDNAGRYIVADVAKMPHVLIAGQTGSGKSVCINSIITSILFRASPEEVRLILIDPKMVELSIYNDIPHLVCPVVTDCKKAASALDWAVAEMTSRYKRFAERGVRDIKGYNKALLPDEKMMPQMVIIIDELADLMMIVPGEVEDSICRLAQLARAAGMHLVIATQRPSVNVVTGIIKANIPSRIAFSVASQVDSRTMIDHGGAEKLLGNGDMLFVPSGINKPMRVQGAWVSDTEVHAITSYIKESSTAAYDENMIEQMENATRTDAEKEEFNSEYDAKLPEAVEIVVEAGQASVSMLQRRMRIGYARAGRLIDEMEQRGIVSEADGAKPRSVLISREEMNSLFEDDPE